MGVEAIFAAAIRGARWRRLTGCSGEKSGLPRTVSGCWRAALRTAALRDSRQRRRRARLWLQRPLLLLLLSHSSSKIAGNPNRLTPPVLCRRDGGQGKKNPPRCSAHSGRFHVAASRQERSPSTQTLRPRTQRVVCFRPRDWSGAELNTAETALSQPEVVPGS